MALYHLYVGSLPYPNRRHSSTAFKCRERTRYPYSKIKDILVFFQQILKSNSQFSKDPLIVPKNSSVEYLPSKTVFLQYIMLLL